MTATSTVPRDEMLLARWCDGDVGAGNELIKRYLRPLRLYFGSKLSSEADVQDLAQATLVACAERQRHEGSRLEGVASFRAYLFGIARNKLLRFYEHKGRKAASGEREDIGSVPLADLSPGPSTLVKLHERVDVLLVAMAALSIDQQTAIQLKYWHGLTQDEVADALGVPLGTVARRIHEAKRKLLERYAELDSGQDVPRGELNDDELRESLISMARRLL
ncbi:RNA polymerase sigma factor [Paraliomyxa miuraensis]|uniref:RNA polymerase sigma factor n=1 Tax=Paraliomyxa miuraensis TaxID=376150 RepID=UPI002251114C|nr:sigma-70 family RNA polymerase sigma factor [Paraliomyxa miuraensis]MCX4247788.1 sigma-70 family RNA polymerase sigma factor [Paraliomyxa miuraensis]